jgi:hypothetical protein
MSVSDLRLVHVAMPDWQQGTKQALLGTDYLLIDPITKIEPIPSQVDFELPNKECLLFGPSSKFRVGGTFQKQLENTTEWINVPAADAATVILAPNWFEMLIKEVSLFHDNYRVATSSELRHITPFINAYLYHNMDRLSKKMLCPQACHPGYCVPTVDGKWSIDQEAWTEYAKIIFNGAMGFDYTPLFLFPFFQGNNYMIDDTVPRIVPTPAMGRIQIRFAFTDSQDHIFRKPDTNKAKYRFVFTEFSMVLEEARLSPLVEKQLVNNKKPLAFPGVTRLQLVEPVPDSSTTYRTRFQDIYLPEALFIFCLHKTVASGTFKFSDNINVSVFSPHNIQSVDLSFDGKRFSLREPHLGTFREDKLDSKQLFDHLATPPFGIRQDVSKLTNTTVAEGSKNTPFPHVYLSLVTGSERQRLIPALDDGSCVTKKADLELNFKFTNDNSPSNAIYVIYAIYTDVNIIYDPKMRHFSSPYLQYMN